MQFVASDVREEGRGSDTWTKASQLMKLEILAVCFLTIGVCFSHVAHTMFQFWPSKERSFGTSERS